MKLLKRYIVLHNGINRNITIKGDDSMFGSKEKGITVTANEFAWKKNRIAIQNGFLVSEGLINVVRIPVKHIETVTYSIEGVKEAIAPELSIIGKGTVLGTLKVGVDLKDDIQDWLIENLGL
jgi:hypothetical protein